MAKVKHTTEIKRIGGYLREVVTFFDASGKPISQIMNPLMVELKPRDILQIFVGAFLMAVPLSFAEEVWTLSQTLKDGKVYSLAAISIVTVSLFVYFNFYRFKLRGHFIEYVKRIFAIYVITASSIALILFLIDKFPIETEPHIAFRRVIIIGFPSVFAAVISDYIK